MKKILSLFIIIFTTLTIKPIDGITKAIQDGYAKAVAELEADKKLEDQYKNKTNQDIRKMRQKAIFKMESLHTIPERIQNQKEIDTYNKILDLRNAKR